jgi:hypothetical protein
MYRHMNDLRELGFLSWEREQKHYGRRIYRITVPDEKGESSMGEGKTPATKADNTCHETGKHLPQLRSPSVLPSSAAVAAPDRPSQDTRSAPMETVEKAAQLANEMKKLANSKSVHTNAYPSDPLRADLWNGIFRKKVADVFHDSRRLPFVKQLRDCVKAAADMLMVQRVATVKDLRGDDVEEAAFERLRPVIDPWASIRDFERRRDLVVTAVVRTVVDAAAEMLQPQKKKPPARAADQQARADRKNGAAA